MTEQFPQQPYAGQIPMAAPPGAQPPKKKAGRIVLLIILVLAALVAGGAAMYFFMQSSEPDDPVVEETVHREPLSEGRATTSLDGAGMTAPDVSKYAYVAQDELIGPRFTDIKVQEPTNLDAPADVVVECTVTATATFKNKGVEISVPVTLPFTYSVDTQSWVPGSLTQGDSVSTPLASAKASDILEHLDEVLYAYDSTYAEDMADAKIVKTTSDLTVEGGTITVDLSKQAEYEEEDGKKFNQLRTCTVELAVIWSNDAGWQVSVSKAGQIEASEPVLIFDPTKKEEAEQTKQENEAEAAAAAAQVKPVNVGKLKYGDKMSVTGVFKKVDKASQLSKENGFTNKDASKDADGNVQMALKLSEPITCTINGEKYTLYYLPIAVSGLGNSWKELIGAKADVSGSFEDSYATSWCPGGLKTLRIELI